MGAYFLTFPLVAITYKFTTGWKANALYQIVVVYWIWFHKRIT